MRKLLLGFVAIVALLAAVGAGYQWLAERADGERFPPPGRVVQVDGLAMHVDCRGRGKPVVILEAGLTTGSWSWGSVFDALARHTRVCAYDRPGMGWSEPINRVADAAEVAGRLRRLLEEADIRGPYVLLGMSAGGVYVREFYGRHPEQVVGMVLVDSSHEQQGSRLPPLAAAARLERMLQLCSVLQPIGAVRAMDALAQLLEQPGIPASARPLLRSRFYQSHYCASTLAEMRSFDGEVHDPDPPASLGDLPLVVLSQGNEPEANPAFGVSVEEVRAQRRGWNELQAELAGLSSRGRQLVAEHSGHMIQLEQPALVIDAVVDMVNAVRGAGVAPQP